MSNIVELPKNSDFAQPNFELIAQTNKNISRLPFFHSGQYQNLHEKAQRVARYVQNLYDAIWTDIPGLKLPTWHKVETREYHSWSTDRITIDTAGRSKVDCLNTLMLALRRLSILGDTSKDVSSR